jgi:hypothetical protein
MAVEPLPAGVRVHLLAILALGYPAGARQTQLGNAPDAVIAWQAQSMLDDYAAYANDNTDPSPDPSDRWMSIQTGVAA